MMKTYLLPAALALTIAASGSALAGMAGNDIDPALYQESSGFAVVKTSAHTDMGYRQSADRGAQFASASAMSDYGRSGTKAPNTHHDPE